MSTAKHLRAAVAIAALSIVAVSPALAQGNGKAKGKERNRQEAVQRERPTLQRRGATEAAVRPRAGDRAAARLPASRQDDRLEDRRTAGRVEDRRTDRRSDSTWEDIIFGRDDDRYEQRRRDVPRGWCQGRGNPHNTPENCGYGSDRRYDWDDDDRYGGYGSYSQAHTAFHRALDREYAARSSQGRSDPLYQIRLRAEKASDHQQWRERMGTRH